MRLRIVVMLTALGLAGSLVAESASAGPQPVLAQKKKGDKVQAKSRAGELTRQIELRPKGLRWGITPKQVSRVYARVFDQEFLPLYQKAQPGPETRTLDSELADRKSLLRRNLVVFGATPTGIDSTPLKGEYSYNNGESMTRVTLRSGSVRNFFFIQDKLWKVYDEHKLRKDGPLGESFEQAVQVVTQKLGAPPKMIEPNYNDQMFSEARWQNSELIIRLIDRGSDVVGMVYVDLSTQQNIGSLRVNQPEDPNKLDDSVADAVRAPAPKAAEPADDKKKKKK
jgi:hypothetical protein